MAIRPECFACLERLIELTVELASQDPEVRHQAHQAARRRLDREFGLEAIPAAIATRFHLDIQQISGNPDPFLPRKTAETAYLADMHRRLAPACEDDLDGLLRLAALGNAIDFFRDQAEVTREMQGGVEFGIADIAAFQRELEAPPGLLLFLADNAGEQFFDQPLVAHLRRRGWRVLYVIKGGAIQNDITRADLAASGLQEALEPLADTGAATVGLHLAGADPAFQELYAAAGLIVAKGMGHFETMSHLRDPRLWFLLQAKCRPVAQALGVDRNSFVFARSPGRSPGAGDQDD
jgi:hypothetical protein